MSPHDEAPRKHKSLADFSGFVDAVSSRQPPGASPLNPLEVIHRHYDPASEVYRILVIHSTLVARKAREISLRHLERHPGTALDLDFVTEAALLHDIGIKLCDAPEIHCDGSEPYIRHGVLGKAILEAEGLPRHAAVCARHTGSGIPREEVIARGLPLPPEDYLPRTAEEKIICVADKFYGKKPRRLWEEKGLDAIAKGIARYGPAALARWEALRAEILGEEG
jgi:uncharacterized protein